MRLIAACFLLAIPLPAVCHADPATPANAVGHISCTLDAAVSGYAKAQRNSFIEHLGPSAGAYGYALEGYFRGDNQGGSLYFSGFDGVEATVRYSGTPSEAKLVMNISKKKADGSLAFSRDEITTGISSPGTSFRLPVDEIIQDDAAFLRRITSLELICTVLSYVSPAAPTAVLAAKVAAQVTPPSNASQASIAGDAARAPATAGSH
ncbi:MAG: hypothetical protein HY075_01080 [Deltaproteobacteria bacterium]|nr:hypothetical protein [Deltaproteobacteria bacterium]